MIQCCVIIKKNPNIKLRAILKVVPPGIEPGTQGFQSFALPTELVQQLAGGKYISNNYRKKRLVFLKIKLMQLIRFFLLWLFGI